MNDYFYVQGASDFLPIEFTRRIAILVRSIMIELKRKAVA